MIDDFPSMHFRFAKRATPERLLLWFQLDSHAEQGPYELNEADTTELVALFERAAAIIRRSEQSTTADATGIAQVAFETDPFALRARRRPDNDD